MSGYPFPPSFMIIGAMRYFLGRKTGDVATFCDWIEANWEDIDQSDKLLIYKELLEAFSKFNAYKHHGQKDKADSIFGADIYRYSWKKVYAISLGWFKASPYNTPV